MLASPTTNPAVISCDLLLASLTAKIPTIPPTTDAAAISSLPPEIMPIIMLKKHVVIIASLLFNNSAISIEAADAGIRLLGQGDITINFAAIVIRMHIEAKSISSLLPTIKSGS